MTLFKVWIPNSESFYLGETGTPLVKSIEIGFYSVMKDQDYEPVLNQFIEKYSSDYLPSAFDVIMHLKSVTGDLAKTQERFCQFKIIIRVSTTQPFHKSILFVE